MVELIVGKKGKGKTKVLLDKVNGAIKEANGSIVYLDKSTKHMYELNNKVRLIDVSVYPIKNADEFVGFVCGIISQDHDLEQVYLDSFLTTAKLEGKDVTGALEQLIAVGEKFNVKFVISMSLDKEEVPESLQDKSFLDDNYIRWGNRGILLGDRIPLLGKKPCENNPDKKIIKKYFISLDEWKKPCYDVTDAAQRGLSA